MSCKIRDIYTVIDCIIDVINKNDYEINRIKGNGLYLDLKKLQESLIYAAPELLRSKYYFEKLTIIINMYINKDDYNEYTWCKEIIDIFLDNKI